MKAKVAITGGDAARALARRAELVFAPHDGALVHGVEEILQRAASEERNTHAYQNQTGHLQQSTRAQVVDESDDGFLMRLEMGEEYASHVVNRGYSDFPVIAGKATGEVNALVSDLSKRGLT